MSTAMPLRLTFGAPDAFFDAARALEAQVHGDRFADYDGSSLFLTVSDAAGVVLGAARVIVPGSATLDSVGEQVARMVGVELGLSWDVASFTVRPGAPGGVGPALCHGLVRALRANRVQSFVADLDANARAVFAAAGLLPSRVPGAAPSMRWARLSELLDVQRRTNPDGYRLVSQGLGMDGVHVPSSDKLRLTAPVRAGLAWARVRQLPSAG